MHLHGRNESLTVLVVDKSSKASSWNDGEEQMGDHLVANEEAIEIPTENDSRVKRFGKSERYLNKKRCLHRE
jgi:hypothetical protein